jgi:hypothetical protein
MSYCRTSSPDSNVYVFGNGRTIEIWVQESEQIDSPSGDLLNEANWQPFPHKRRGQHFDCETAQQCLDTLLMLRSEGIKVPERALKRLRSEITGDSNAR